MLGFFLTVILRNIFYKENKNIAFIIQHYFAEKKGKKNKVLLENL